MQTVWQELLYAVRTLSQKPAFTTVAVLTLALGIGANTAIFSIANAVLLRPLAFKDSSQLMMIWETLPKNPKATVHTGPFIFKYWKENARSFDRIAAIAPANYTLTQAGEPEHINSAWIAADFLPLLGVSPSLGRGFFAEDEQPGRDHVAILSHGLWQQRFGGDREVIGKKITLNDKPFVVVGVLPEGFQFPTVKADIWIPLRLEPSWAAHVVGRLKPGVTFEQAQAEMNVLVTRLQEQNPKRTQRDVSVVPLQQQGTSGVRPAIRILLGAVGMLLLIACANIANLLLAHAAGRRKEFAVRAALGASRYRLARQLFTESLLLSLLGSAAGLLLALWCIDFFIVSGPRDILRLQDTNLDARVLGFTLGVALLTSLLSGLAPMLRISKLDLNAALKDASQSLSGGGRQERARNLITVAEISLAVMLLVGAGLMIRSYILLQRVDPGWSPDWVLAMRIPLPIARYAGDHQRSVFFQKLLERVQFLPGVQSAAVANNLPLSGSEYFYFSKHAGPQGADSEEKPVRTETHLISPEYFRTLRIPLLKGRTFTQRDTKEAPAVIIISDGLARRLFPGKDALGQRIQVIMDRTPREIVGIVGDIKHRGLDKRTVPEIYIPYLQLPPIEGELVVRTLSDPAGIAAALKQEVWAIDKDQPISRIATMEHLMSELVAQRRFNTLLLGAFAAAALVLATIGIYGVVSYSVTRRTREIGIRMALGARTTDVLWLVLRQGGNLAIIGTMIGLAGALALTRLIQSFLFGVDATDPATFVAISLLLVCVALLASYLPARRAAKVDPMVALRRE